MSTDEGGKIITSRQTGKILAKKALQGGLKKVVFDRGGYKFHGRVKAFADGVREGGLEF
jgi:large subunit ribosomal protein L18